MSTWSHITGCAFVKHALKSRSHWLRPNPKRLREFSGKPSHTLYYTCMCMYQVLKGGYAIWQNTLQVVDQAADKDLVLHFIHPFNISSCITPLCVTKCGNSYSDESVWNYYIESFNCRVVMWLYFISTCSNFTSHVKTANRVQNIQSNA